MKGTTDDLVNKVIAVGEAYARDRNMGMLSATPETFLWIRAIIEVLINDTSILKVKRSKDAKRYPLIHIAKDGDTGYDLTTITPYWSHWSDPMERAREFERLVEQHCKGNNIDISTPDRRQAFIQSKEWDYVNEFAETQVFRQTITIRPGCRGVVPTGIQLELPKGSWASIEPRSSTSKQMIVVPKGVIDEGYRGELFAVLLNVGHEPVVIRHGQRWVQLIIHERRNRNITIEEVEELSGSERGDTGFGSTGR